MSKFTSPEWTSASTACKTNDTALLDRAIRTVPDDERSEFYSHVRRGAIANNSMTILRHLAERGVSFSDISTRDVVASQKTSQEVLEFLLAHGWDINARDTSASDTAAEPFMWHVVSNGDTVAWCLARGASVHPRDLEPLQNDRITASQRACEQILEKAAKNGSVATFELLRSKGAPLGWRPLHHAVEAATYGNQEPADPEKDTEEQKQSRRSHVERMAMVRHLIDVVKLDVNAPDQPPCSQIPMRNGTPICYIPGSAMLQRDTRELTWLLLDRGADPAPALELAKGEGYIKFAEDVQAWTKEKKSNDRKCCLQ